LVSGFYIAQLQGLNGKSTSVKFSAN
jgi:hypothetical protein